MLRIYLLLITSATLLFSGCDDTPIDNRIDNDPVEVPGLVIANSDSSADATLGALQNALDANDNIGIVATVNHSNNADAVGQALPFTQVILFGNPNLGTPLMQQNQTAGIDLPQKFLVYQNSNNEVAVAYNDPQYVVDRHGISGQDEIVTTISDALSTFAENAAGNPAELSDSTGTAEEGEGLVSVPSANSVDVTFENLEEAIESNDQLAILAELNHQDNAANVGLELRPTRLLVFGNPNLGTPLMQNRQTTAIDLPQKMLVYENADGSVFIVYNDPEYLEDRHDIEGNEEQLDMISDALESLADSAAVAEQQ
jgi:uncharacterized protein (DUF302 family)